MSSKKKNADKELLEGYREKFDALEDKRKKHTSQAIERRRHDVWEMMCQDIPRSEMAKLLGVSRGTIWIDIKYWRKKMGRSVTRMKDDPEAADLEAGLIRGKIDSVVAACFQEYSMAKSGSEKAKFLDLANKALSTKARILQESGYMRKAGIEVKHTLEKQITFTDRLGPDSPLSELDNPTTRHKLLSLASQILQQAEGGIIDAEATIINPEPTAPEPPTSNPGASTAT